jgi:ribonuclease HI
MAGTPATRVVVHADESCLGNDGSKPCPGGNAALIEAPAGDSVARWDFYESSPQTTNNKMALAGAIATLEWIRRQWRHAGVVYVSDSQYLVKGLREWVYGWMSRGWKRKEGPILNLELWMEAVEAARPHQVQWKWVRGHDGHLQNEYANFLATRTAREQTTSSGIVSSQFDDWLTSERDHGRMAAQPQAFPTSDQFRPIRPYPVIARTALIT